MHRTYHIVIVDASRCNVRKVENKIHVLEWIFHLNRSFTTNFRSNGSSVPKKILCFPSKICSSSIGSKIWKRCQRLHKSKRFPLGLVISQDTLLFRFRTTAYSLALQDRLCPFHPNIKIDKNLSGYCQRIWILMNGISFDKDYIFFEYIIPTFKNSINNISNANIFFH